MRPASSAPASPAQVSAHAGDRTATLATYRTAVATGADYVELDIRRTADGELVAFHDASTARGEPLAAVGYSRLCDLAGYQVPVPERGRRAGGPLPWPRRQCHRHQVKVMVWTVNREPELRYWLTRGRADVLITDRPAAAVALRDQLG